MNSDQAVGSAKRAAGELEEGLGQAVGDAQTETRGAVRQAEGTAQEVYGQAKETIFDLEKTLRSTVEQKPFVALLVTFLAGCVVGKMLMGRSY